MPLVALSLLTWTLFIPVAILNGIVRESTYKKLLGDLVAHQVSTVIAAASFTVLVYIMLGRRFLGLTPVWLLGTGIMWVVMTIVFEFGFGHFVDKKPWSKLLADYNIFQGRVWGIFLLWILLTPLLVHLLKG